MFIKEPRPGFVKTRLAAEIGDIRAAELYCEMVERILVTLASKPKHFFRVGFFSGRKESILEKWGPFCDRWLEQPEGDLGVKLDFGFRNILTPAVAIGTDCVEITHRDLDDAFETLKHVDSVIGPAWDGGYYLIGFRNYQVNVFERIRWSTEHTCSDQRERLEQSGLQIQFLRTLRDIDTLADWIASPSTPTEPEGN